MRTGARPLEDADFYEAELESKITAPIALIEPLKIIVVGGASASS
jgi:type II secretory pathway component PulF